MDDAHKLTVEVAPEGLFTHTALQHHAGERATKSNMY